MKKFNIKLKSKSIVAINLFLIFVLMTVSVYAWFASQVNNTVDAYDIHVESDNALELSFDQVTWNGTLNLADLVNSKGESVLENMKLVEVTSDGETFRIPQLTQYANYAVVNTSGTWTNASPNQDYLDFTVHMRSKDQLKVYLSSASAASPVSTNVSGVNCGNPSVYASGEDAFSKDCVVGALRVSYLNDDSTRYIWITNPEYHLNNEIGTSTFTMDTNANTKTYADGSGVTKADGGDGLFVWNNPKTHYYYSGNTISEFTNSLTTLPDTITNAPASTDKRTLVATLSGTPDSNGYYTDNVTFRVWIEGCDTEARRALVDGKFNLSLVLDTYGF